MRRAFYRSVGLLSIVSLSLSGCVAATFKTTPKLERSTADMRVLLMPIDVELSLLTAGGVQEPNAEWTGQARKHLVSSVSKALQDRKALLIEYASPQGELGPRHPHVQLAKLHQAVGFSIIRHKIEPVLQLPHKAEVFDWTLGKEARHLKEAYNADYAMFVFMRDSYTSAGRAAAIFLAAVLLGAHIPGGQQAGFASLVDLKTGNIVWFNLVARGTGDLRNAKDAEETVGELLKELPK